MKTLVFLSMVAFLGTTSLAQVSDGLINTFDSGAENWREGAGSPNPPTVFTADGVGGANDPYLRNISSGNNGAGGKWAMFNTSNDWAGDYIGASIILLQMDIRNSGETTINLRLAMQTAIEERVCSSNGIEIQPDTNWQNIQIPLDPQAMTLLSGTGVINVMSNVSEVRLLSAAFPTWRGENIEASIDIDNLTLIALEDTSLNVNCTILNQASSIDTADGRVNVEILGGNAPYVSDITGPDGTTTIDLQLGNNIIEELAPGDYTVTVIDADAESNSCNFTIISPEDELLLSCNVIRQVTQMGGSDGIAEINIIGGVEPFFITQTFLGQVSNIIAGRGTTQLPNLMPGDYDISVRDDSGAVASCEFTITEPSGEGDRFEAILTSKNEVPPVSEFGSGTIDITLIGQNMIVSGSFSGLSSPVATGINGGAHIHFGYAGENGDVSIPLNVTLDSGGRSGSFFAGNNTFNLTSQQVIALRTRRLYVNIHTEGYPAGEIRGQITPAAMNYYSANLFGSYMSPNVMTEGSGSIILELNGDQLIVTGSFDELEGDFNSDLGAQIKFGFPGQNGESIINTIVSPNATNRGGTWVADNNIFQLTAQQREDLRNRRLHIVVNSLRFPQGEIRGQIIPHESLTLFRAYMNGMEEVPRVLTKGDGMMLLEATNDGNFVLSGSIQNLSDTLATNIGGGIHIHAGSAGRTGDVVLPISVQPNSDSSGLIISPETNIISLNATNIDQLLNHGLYVNVHTGSHPSGEIRGQIVPEGAVIFGCPLTGILSIPQVNTISNGYLIAVLRGNELSVSGSVNDLSNSILSANTGASLHLGLAGTESDIEFLLATNPEDTGFDVTISPEFNRFEMSQLQRLTLKGRAVYANIKTQVNPTGELRGQFLQQGQLYFTTHLTGNQSIPAKQTAGRGTIIIEVNGDQLLVSGSISDLENATNQPASINMGLLGRNGPVEFSLETSLDNPNNKLFNPIRNSFVIDTQFVNALLDRNYYVTIPSQNRPLGEIRGQLLPIVDGHFLANISDELSVNSIIPYGYSTIELNGSNITVSGTIDSIDMVDSTLMVGLSVGDLLEEGDLITTLQSNLDTLAGSVTVHASNNMVELATDNIAELLNGNIFLHLSNLSEDLSARGHYLMSTNEFPSPVSIIAPENESSLEVNPDLDIAILVDWTDSEDDNNVVYSYMVSPDSSFEADSSRFELYRGSPSMFTTDMVLLDSLMTSLGVDSVGSIKLYQRVIASDGSLSSKSTTSCFTLNRGMTTSAEDFRAMGIGFYPNPFNDFLTVEVNNVGPEPIGIMIFDVEGRLIMQQNITTTTDLITKDWASGIYYVQVNGVSMPMIKL